MRRLAALACALGLLLAGCGGPPAEDDALHVLATTYPAYLFTTAVAEGAEGVEVDLLVNQPTSCLHDYTLTVADMKAVQRADAIVMNGAGLEDFLADALEGAEAAVIDCSAGLELLPAQGHEGHHHETEYDPHFWMDPNYAARMVEAIVQGLSALDAGGADLFRLNGDLARQTLAGAAADWAGRLESWQGRSIITFHDGFQYFARFLGLDISKAIEEEEGATVSARELKEIVGLLRQEGPGSIPIFTEVNGSTASAETIAREVGCQVYELSMLMSGEGTGIQPYLEAMERNIQATTEAFS